MMKGAMKGISKTQVGGIMVMITNLNGHISLIMLLHLLHFL